MGRLQDFQNVTTDTSWANLNQLYTRRTTVTKDLSNSTASNRQGNSRNKKIDHLANQDTLYELPDFYMFFNMSQNLNLSHKVIAGGGNKNFLVG